MLIDRFAELLVFGFMPLMIGTMALPIATTAGAQTIGAVSGELLYRERIALPPDAVTVVTLAESSDKGRSGEVLASREIGNAGQAPIRFALDVPPSAIKAGHTYTLSGRINVGGRTWFAGELANVDAASLSGVQLLLKRSS